MYGLSGKLHRTLTSERVVRWSRRSLVTLATLHALGFGPSAAQSPGCTVQPAPTPPPRQVLRCADGLAIEAEARSDYTLRARSTTGIPHEAVLRSGALLVNAPAQASGRRFQILTPQAVAAVRGTQWAVDVGGGKTAVFVVDGQVSVRRPTGRRAVTLGPGEGVDVAADAAPLAVRRWSPQRAAALLARFGR
ncbi:MAG TPA: FecR domain-containing protein [Microvirga sp.]|nr:FecR domain-containing protein [Microvirga sp.]